MSIADNFSSHIRWKRRARKKAHRQVCTRRRTRRIEKWQGWGKLMKMKKKKKKKRQAFDTPASCHIFSLARKDMQTFSLVVYFSVVLGLSRSHVSFSFLLLLLLASLKIPPLNFFFLSLFSLSLLFLCFPSSLLFLLLCTAYLLMLMLLLLML